MVPIRALEVTTRQVVDYISCNVQTPWILLIWTRYIALCKRDHVTWLHGTEARPAFTLEQPRSTQAATVERKIH